MSPLSERAERVLVWLEGEWSRHRLKGKYKTWNSRPLVSKLLDRTCCRTELDGWEALRELSEAGVIETGAPLWARQRLNVRVALSEALRHRLEAELARVDDSLALDDGQAALWRHALDGVLEGWSLTDQHRLVAGLRGLAAALPAAYDDSAFAASARYLLGSSKLLTALPRELVQAFGIEPGAFRAPLSRMLAAMPPRPQGLLLIENPQSFDQACRLGLHRRLALVCSFGYGVSLAQALEHPERVRLIGETPTTLSLAELLALPDKTYWGDLDPEGLRIYRRLAAALPGLRLSALYAPMLAAFEESGGHPLHGLTGKAGQRAAGDWSRGLDQEWLDDDRLETLAGRPLDEAAARRWLACLEEVGSD